MGHEPYFSGIGSDVANYPALPGIGGKETFGNLVLGKRAAKNISRNDRIVVIPDVDPAEPFIACSEVMDFLAA